MAPEDRNWVRRTVHGAAGGMLGVDYEDERREDPNATPPPVPPAHALRGPGGEIQKLSNVSVSFKDERRFCRQSLEPTQFHLISRQIVASPQGLIEPVLGLVGETFTKFNRSLATRRLGPLMCGTSGIDQMAWMRRCASFILPLQKVGGHFVCGCE